MRALPGSTPLLTALQSRAADAWTIDEAGVPGIVLMEHAGRAVALKARDLGAARVAIVCGPGNNGGDGWVAARHLAGFGVEVDLFTTVDPGALQGDARLTAELFLSMSAARGWNPPSPSDALVQTLEYDLVVDALFGTGLKRPLRDEGARLAELMNRGAPVLAVDLPSGLYTSGAAPEGPHVVADWSMTFGGLKIAHAAEPTAFYCGEVTDAEVGIFPGPDQAVSVFLPPPWRPEPVSPLAHKGRFGHVGVLMGAPGTRGAAELAAYAALRAGAGKVSLLGAERASMPELMTRPGRELTGLSALVVGPGLGDQLELARAVFAAAREESLPLVVDAEAIALVSELDDEAAVVVTPHPGEAARALGTSSSAVQADRMAAFSQLATRFTWVLKGACPIVGDREHAYIVPGGNPALGVGGSGDVLAGLIGAHLARGEPPVVAALYGTQRHQLAGTRLTRGALAREIADELTHE